MQLEALAGAGDEESRDTLDNAPPMPPLAAHLWEWWLELAETRTSSGFGPNPITRHDVHAWEADENRRLRSWERRLIFRIDALWRASVQPEPAKETK